MFYKNKLSIQIVSSFLDSSYDKKKSYLPFQIRNKILKVFEAIVGSGIPSAVISWPGTAALCYPDRQKLLIALRLYFLIGSRNLVFWEDWSYQGFYKADLFINS